MKIFSESEQVRYQNTVRRSGDPRLLYLHRVESVEVEERGGVR